jgi:dihydrofolate reductase
MSRRIVMFNRVSADGCFAGRDGNLNWTVPDNEIDHGAKEAFSKFDAVLLGRKTYELFAQFWPKVDVSKPTIAGPHGGQSPDLRDIAVFLNETTKLVFSTTMKQASWKNSRIVERVDRDEIESMKRSPGKDMILFGSGSIVSELARQGLIDEYQFVVSPVLIGDGRHMTSTLDTVTRLSLLEAKPYGSGNVMLRYGR